MKNGESKQPASVLLYTGDTTEKGGELLDLLGKIVSGAHIETYRSVESLLERLHQPRYDPTILILQITNGEELKSILSIQSFLSDMRIILILPDRKSDTVMMGHSLRPRFLSYCDNDLTDVVAVLAKMTNRENALNAFQK